MKHFRFLNFLKTKLNDNSEKKKFEKKKYCKNIRRRMNLFDELQPKDEKFGIFLEISILLA